MTIGEKINELRKAKNMQFVELAKKSGVSAVTLSNWNKGKRKPQPIALKKVADALEVDFEELTKFL